MHYPDDDTYEELDLRELLALKHIAISWVKLGERGLHWAPHTVLPSTCCCKASTLTVAEIAYYTAAAVAGNVWLHAPSPPCTDLWLTQASSLAASSQGALLPLPSPCTVPLPSVARSRNAQRQCQAASRRDARGAGQHGGVR